MAKGICSIEGCSRPVVARTLCGAHWKRWRRGAPIDAPLVLVRGVCSIDGCGAPHFGRGWCHKHYERWRSHGDPLVVRQPGFDPLPVAERFWSKVDRGAPDECWPWTAATRGDGYGWFHISWKPRVIDRAHRVAWILTNGAIPDDQPYVLHRCDVRRCVNPAHLFLGTHADNMRDMAAKGRHPWANPATNPNTRRTTSAH